LIMLPPFATKHYQSYGTPPEAIAPLVPYLKNKGIKTIWEPAAGDGYLARYLKREGFSVIATDLSQGIDFLRTDLSILYDAIVTNPPFNLRTDFLRRSYHLGKPFCLLMPLLVTREIAGLAKLYGIELLILSRRVRFLKDKKRMDTSPFNVAWHCWGILPKQLIIV
jgi:hypothetical protein